MNKRCWSIESSFEFIEIRNTQFKNNKLLNGDHKGCFDICELKETKNMD